MSVLNPLNHAATIRMPAAGTPPVTTEEIAAVLGEHDASAEQALSMYARRSSYSPQDALYHQGSACDSVYFITSGLLKLVTYLPNGRARIVRLRRPGAVLGLSGLFDLPYEHTAVAVTPVDVLCLPLSTMRHLREENMAVYVNLAERWHDDLQDADRWITQFSTGPIRGRVARLLAFLSQSGSGPEEAADGQLQLLTCEEMGSILGVTNESVSRILAEFKRRHILAHHTGGSNRLYAADLQRLRDIAEE